MSNGHDERFWAALEFRPPGRSYCIREAHTLRELDEVHRITHDSIVEGGYMAPQRGGRIITYPALDPSPLATILVAMENGRVIGTNSIIADGPMGLHTDYNFPQETEAVRREGGRLISSFRIATDPSWPARHGRALVMDMLRWTIFLALHKYRFETMLCTVNPKHESLYPRLWNADILARLDAMSHGGVSAGATLIRVDWARAVHKLGEETAALAAEHLPAAEEQDFGAVGKGPTSRGDEGTPSGAHARALGPVTA